MEPVCWWKSLPLYLKSSISAAMVGLQLSSRQISLLSDGSSFIPAIYSGGGSPYGWNAFTLSDFLSLPLNRTSLSLLFQNREENGRSWQFPLPEAPSFGGDGGHSAQPGSLSASNFLRRRSPSLFLDCPSLFSDLLTDLQIKVKTPNPASAASLQPNDPLSPAL